MGTLARFASPIELAAMRISSADPSSWLRWWAE